jgi:hypothetical protein
VAENGKAAFIKVYVIGQLPGMEEIIDVIKKQ